VAVPVLYRCCLSCRFAIKMDTHWVSRLQKGIDIRHLRNTDIEGVRVIWWDLRRMLWFGW